MCRPATIAVEVASDLTSSDGFSNVITDMDIDSGHIASRKSLAFPSELIRHILTFMDDEEGTPTWDASLDLHRLLFISRSWRSATEQYLYRYVSVPGGNGILFFDTLTSRPDLARTVRELKFASYARLPAPDDAFDRFAEGLRLLVNLRDLSIWARTCELDDDLSVVHVFDEITGTSLLRGYFPFQLYRFCTNMIWDDSMRDFLVAQSQIRILALSGSTDTSVSHLLPSDALPLLRSVYALPGFLKDITDPPPVTHAHISSLGTSAALEADCATDLGMFGKSLKVLGFSRTANCEDVPILDNAALVRRFALACPNITFLGIYDIFLTWTPREFSAMADVVTGNFPHLIVFAWGSFYNPHALQSDWDSSEYDGFQTDSDAEDSHHEKLAYYAEEFLNRHCTRTLKYVVVVGFNRDPEYTPAYFYKEAPDEIGMVCGMPWWRSAHDSFESIDPEDPMNMIERGVYNPHRFDEDPTWVPQDYSHFLKHASISDIRTPDNEYEREWGRIQTAHFEDEMEQYVPYSCI